MRIRDPVIATYWREQGSEVPQFRLVYHNGQSWQAKQVDGEGLATKEPEEVSVLEWKP